MESREMWKDVSLSNCVDCKIQPTVMAPKDDNLKGGCD